MPICLAELCCGTKWNARLLPIMAAIFAVTVTGTPASATPKKINPEWSVVGFRFETTNNQVEISKAGSGIYVDPGVILTAAHVLEPAVDQNTMLPITPGFKAGDEVEFVMHYRVMKAKILFIDHQSDRAALNVLDEPDDPPLPRCRQRPVVGKKVGVLIDITGRGSAAFSDFSGMAEIEDRAIRARLPLDVPEDQRHDEDMISVASILQHGASGGGILDLQTFCVYGIISYVDGEHGPHTFVIPVDRFFEAEQEQPNK